MICVALEIATKSQEIVLLSFVLSVTVTCLLHFFAEKTEGAECTTCRMPFVGAHARMMNQPQVHAQHCITSN